ncbi:MAG TPA: hypothetical protein PLW93_00350 [Candidatus Absconditabacterales bacterium]|nr:hypothetical protein [Candidatus Absconditabacterales bacterium]
MALLDDIKALIGRNNISDATNAALDAAITQTATQFSSPAVETAQQALSPIAQSQAVSLPIETLSQAPIFQAVEPIQYFPEQLPESGSGGQGLFGELAKAPLLLNPITAVPVITKGLFDRFSDNEVMQDYIVPLLDIALPGIKEKTYGKAPYQTLNVPGLSSLTFNDIKRLNEQYENTVKDAPIANRQEILDGILNQYNVSVSVDEWNKKVIPTYIQYYSKTKDYFDDKKITNNYGNTPEQITSAENYKTKLTNDAIKLFEDRAFNFFQSQGKSASEQQQAYAIQSNNFKDDLNTILDTYKNLELIVKANPSKDREGLLSVGRKIVEGYADRLSQAYIRQSEADEKGVNADEYKLQKVKELGRNSFNQYLGGTKSEGLNENVVESIINPEDKIKNLQHLARIGTYKGDIGEKIIPEAYNIFGLGGNFLVSGVKGLASSLGGAKSSWWSPFSDVGLTDTNLGYRGTLADVDSKALSQLGYAVQNIPEIAVGLYSMKQGISSANAIPVVRGISRFETLNDILNAGFKFATLGSKILTANAVIGAPLERLSTSTTDGELAFNLLFDFDWLDIAKPLLQLTSLDNLGTRLLKSAGDIGLKNEYEIALLAGKRKVTEEIDKAVKGIDLDKLPPAEAIKSIDTRSPGLQKAVSALDEIGGSITTLTQQEIKRMQSGIDLIEGAFSELSKQDPVTTNEILKSIFGKTLIKDTVTELVVESVKNGTQLGDEAVKRVQQVEGVVNSILGDKKLNIADAIRYAYDIKEPVWFAGRYSGINYEEKKIDNIPGEFKDIISSKDQVFTAAQIKEINSRVVGGDVDVIPVRGGFKITPKGFDQLGIKIALPDIVDEQYIEGLVEQGLATNTFKANYDKINNILSKIVC